MKAAQDLKNDMNILLPKYKKFEDIDKLIEVCTEVKEKIIEIINSCMSMQP